VIAPPLMRGSPAARSNNDSRNLARSSAVNMASILFHPNAAMK
jgi:hypothetical protein